MTISNREICLSKDGGCLFLDCLLGSWNLASSLVRKLISVIRGH
jgi:hypothetical protein